MVLLLATGITATQTCPTAANAAPTPVTASAGIVQAMLADRARRAARPVASRAAASTSRRTAVVAFVRNQRGKLYQYGAIGLSRYDCSGLTLRSFRQAGISLPHSSGAQRGRGVAVSSRNAQVGDLVSYNGHVGILVGRWTMVDAPGTGRRIAERRVWRGQGLQFRRLIA